jgi:hypothetical protein
MSYCLGEGAYSTLFQQFFFPHGFSAEALTCVHEDVEHLSKTSTYLSPEKAIFVITTTACTRLMHLNPALIY